MARKRPSDVVVTGVGTLAVAPGAAITPTRWAAAAARLARMDRLCALALVGCDAALVDAALAPTAAEWNGERTAIVLGTAYGCHATNEDYYRGLLREGPAGVSPRLFAYTLPSSPVGEISIHYGVRGPALALGGGLTAGLDALATGVELVADGRADRVLVCAAEVATPFLARLLASAGATAPLVDAGAALVLERAADAAARGATPRGRLIGHAAAFHAGAPDVAVAAAVTRALGEAELGPGAVRHLLSDGEVGAAARRAGVRAAPTPPPAGALGAAPLYAVARFFADGDADALALACAADPAGGGAAALVVR